MKNIAYFLFGMGLIITIIIVIFTVILTGIAFIVWSLPTFTAIDWGILVRILIAISFVINTLLVFSGYGFKWWKELTFY